MYAIKLMLCVDIITILICSIVLIRFARLSHSHPAVIYLYFHVYTFTQRLFGISSGAPTLFSTWGSSFEPVIYPEIVRASIVGDIALVIMTMAWVRASLVESRIIKLLEVSKEHIGSRLSLSYIWRVVAVAFPIGVVSLALLARLPGFGERETISLGDWQESSWFLIIQSWAGLSLLALIYWYGLRWWLIVPITLYLFIMSYQGYHRFRVLIPIILLVQIYLDRRGAKWPPAYVTVLLLSFMLLFYPLKTIGNMAQAGASVGEIVNSSQDIIRNALRGSADDQVFLDEFASALTLIDRNATFYYGKTYLALLTLPIPRQWWPAKPGLADYLADFSRPWRPMGETGMIVTFLGESYANFGYIGLAIISYLLAYWLARLYFQAYRRGYYTVTRFAYLLLACNFLQVYRDGLTSIVVFTLVNMMPLIWIIFLHWIFPVRRKEYLKIGNG